MATFAKPYTYVPTPPRSKSTAARRKPAPKQVSIFDKLQHIKPNNAALSTPRPAVAAAAAAAADDNRGEGPGIRETGTVYDGSGDDDDNDLPTVEDILYTALQKEGFATENRRPDNIAFGVSDTTAEERGGSLNDNGPAPGDNSGGSPEDPIVLQGDGDSSVSEADVNDNGLRAESVAALGAGLFDSLKAAIDSTTPAPTRSSDGWHDIDDFPEPAPRLRLAEQGASTPDSLPHTSSSRLSSELLHDSVSTDPKATSPSSSQRPRYYGASLETQLS